MEAPFFTYTNQKCETRTNGTWESAIATAAGPAGLAFRDSDVVYVTELGPNWPAAPGEMHAYLSDGTSVFSVSQIPITNIPPNGAAGSGLAIDADGNAYIATHNHPGATKVTASGTASDWTGYVYDLFWGRDAVFSPDGELYMIQGLRSGTDPRSTVAKIDKLTGVVTFPLIDVPWLDGIAFDHSGNTYLSEYNQNTVAIVLSGTNTIIPFASVPYASKSALGPDGQLYVLSSPMETGQGSFNEIYTVDLNTGDVSLFATNLPYTRDIAFAPQTSVVPEPSSFILSLCALVSIGVVGFITTRHNRKLRQTP